MSWLDPCKHCLNKYVIMLGGFKWRVHVNLTQQRPVLSVSGHKDTSDAHSKSIDGGKKEEKKPTGKLFWHWN